MYNAQSKMMHCFGTTVLWLDTPFMVLVRKSMGTVWLGSSVIEHWHGKPEALRSRPGQAQDFFTSPVKVWHQMYILTVYMLWFLASLRGESQGIWRGRSVQAHDFFLIQYRYVRSRTAHRTIEQCFVF